jgi:hypothetical protein
MVGAVENVAPLTVTTGGTTYTPLVGGPSVTVTLPVPGGSPCPCKVLVIVTALFTGSSPNSAGAMSVALVPVGGGPLDSIDANALVASGNDPFRASATSLFSNVGAGTRTFTATYKLVGGGTASFSERSIIVVPL